MERVACNLCLSWDQELVYSMPDRLYYRDEWFHIVRCRNCGLGFVNPRPKYEEMSRYYPPEFYHYFDREREFHLKRYHEEARYLDGIESTAEPRILLDIGCANGDFPRFMRDRGWLVEGVEISQQSRGITDFVVYREQFPDIKAKRARYDAITAWAVMEHVHDPGAYFRKAAELLKPGGLFIFLVTNFESISSRHLFAEDPPRHLYFYTDTTIRKYLEPNQLKLVTSVNDDKIFAMPPTHWLRYYIYKYVLRREFLFHDIPESRRDYLDKNGFQNNFINSLHYTLLHPLTVFDRLLMPFYAGVQKARGSYGITTYAARKES